jgi:hypothetical protein
MLKYTHESFCGDTHFTVPTFDFFFKFNTPKPNKERFIVERGDLGRIVKSTILQYT